MGTTYVKMAGYNRIFILKESGNGVHVLVEATEDQKPFAITDHTFKTCVEECDPPETFTCPKRRVTFRLLLKENVDYFYQRHGRGRGCSFCGQPNH
jgi:hypothetical protein